MCGRFTLRAAPQELAQEFDLFDWPELTARYNIAPTQAVPVVRLSADGKQREAVLMRWGLIPSWATDPKIGNRMINARADSVAVKPAFRAAFKRRRCLVPADGFFEWQKGATPKKPFHIHLASGRPFAMAGLWEQWGHDSDSLQSFTIITTDANDQLKALHDRMPVILEKKDYDAWLNPGDSGPQAMSLLKPFTAEPLELTTVDTWVNSPQHDDPRCVTPI
jgi:putative SOS response-associated peptidase YedK